MIGENGTEGEKLNEDDLLVQIKLKTQRECIIGVWQDHVAIKDKEEWNEQAEGF